MSPEAPTTGTPCELLIFGDSNYLLASIWGKYGDYREEGYEEVKIMLPCMVFSPYGGFYEKPNVEAGSSGENVPHEIAGLLDGWLTLKGAPLKFRAVVELTGEIPS